MQEDDNYGFRNPAAFAAAQRGDLENAIIASTPGGIERQEAAGQQELCQSGKLPIRAPWDALKRMGFEQKEPVEPVDGIFYNVIFPKGWSLKPTEHSMWNYLLDANGSKRARVFYKAAFYDRSATLYLEQRFEIDAHIRTEENELSDSKIFAAVKDNKTNDFATQIYKFEFDPKADEFDKEKGRYGVRDKARNELKEWLDKNYPEWGNPEAYWAD